MGPTNPASHAHTAADALARMIRDVRTGRAQWPNRTVTRQGVADLAAVADQLAVAVQQITTALTADGQQLPQAVARLMQGSQAAATAATHLTTAHRALRTK